MKFAIKSPFEVLSFKNSNWCNFLKPVSYYFTKWVILTFKWTRAKLMGTSWIFQISNVARAQEFCDSFWKSKFYNFFNRSCLIKLERLSRNRQIHMPNFRAFLRFICHFAEIGTKYQIALLAHVSFFNSRIFDLIFKVNKTGSHYISLIYVPENPSKGLENA